MTFVLPMVYNFEQNIYEGENVFETGMNVLGQGIYFIILKNGSRSFAKAMGLKL